MSEDKDIVEAKSGFSVVIVIVVALLSLAIGYGAGAFTGQPVLTALGNKQEKVLPNSAV